MRKIKSLLTILLVLLVFNDATLQSEAKTVTLYISDDDSKSGQESDPASWQTSRNLVSDHEYVGEVSDGLPNGQGTETFPSGVEYVGSFKDGKRNGQGTMTLSEGRVFSGFWRDGKFIGEEPLEQKPPKITSARYTLARKIQRVGRSPIQPAGKQAETQKVTMSMLEKSVMDCRTEWGNMLIQMV